MTHKHEWRMLKWDGSANKGVAICVSKFNCTAMLTDKEAERRLNAVECLSVEDIGKILAMIDKIPFAYLLETWKPLVDYGKAIK